MARDSGDPEDLVDPPIPDEDAPEDLQDDALVEDEADEESESESPDEVSAKPSQQVQTGEPERQPSRRDRRIEALTTSLAEERRQREALNQRIDALLAAGNRAQPQVQETPEARATRLALLTPEERMTVELNDAKQTIAREMYQMRLLTADSADRAAFQAKAAVDSRYKKWESQVEAELAKLQSQGQTIERVKLMKYLIGDEVLEKSNGPEVKQQRTAAQARVQRQTTRPANSGSDVAASRRDRSSSLERRLENVEL